MTQTRRRSSGPQEAEIGSRSSKVCGRVSLTVRGTVGQCTWTAVRCRFRSLQNDRSRSVELRVPVRLPWRLRMRPHLVGPVHLLGPCRRRLWPPHSRPRVQARRHRQHTQRVAATPRLLTVERRSRCAPSSRRNRQRPHCQPCIRPPSFHRQG